MPKAAFIYAIDSNGEIWSTPYSIKSEFKSRGWEIIDVSLFDHKNRYTSDNLIDFVYAYDLYEPDIILFFDYGRYDSEWLDKKHFPKSFFVGEMGDEWQNYDKNYPKSHKFDMIHTPDYSCYLKYKEAGRNVEWLPHWTDTKIYQRKLGNPSIDVVSSRGPGGSQFLDYMTQILGSKFVNRNGFMGEDHGRFLSSGKIVLQSSRFHEFTRRIPEAMSVGRLVITDKLPEHTHIDDLFIDGEDYVTYTDIPEAISKINYYLNNSVERERIALNGYRKTLAGHTQVQRVDTIISKYKEFLNNKI